MTTVFIALLKGINVGKNNRVSMTELKLSFEALGLIRVETYIQSGNIIFESGEDEETLKRKIGAAIKDSLGFSAVVVLRSSEELAALIDGCPFPAAEISEAEAANSEGECNYVILLAEAPLPEDILPKSCEDEKLRILGRDIYLLLHHGIRSSKLADYLQKRYTAGTIRNWNTITKLHSLAEARKQ
jgi:uncharacterized protein (DUF1697 family)